MIDNLPNNIAIEPLPFGEVVELTDADRDHIADCLIGGYTTGVFTGENGQAIAWSQS